MPGFGEEKQKQASWEGKHMLTIMAYGLVGGPLIVLAAIYILWRLPDRYWR
jgi:hypothetical protein